MGWMRAASFGVAAVLGLGAAPDASRAATEVPGLPCVRADAAPVYQGVGWTHFVDVTNACAFDVVCDVATTVDPTPTYRVRVLAGEVERVRTRAGSNTWAFDPVVACGRSASSSAE